MNHQRFTKFVVLTCLLVVSITSGERIRTNPSALVQPLINQIAMETPNQQVRVIVQKQGQNDFVESMAEALGGVVVRDLYIINAVVLDMAAGQVVELATNQWVRFISLDAPVESTDGVASGKPNSQEDNYYLDTTNAHEVWDMGYTGAGIGVAVIDSGISDDPDLNTIRRISFNPNSTTVNDVNGHGTHVAGIIGGQGVDSEGRYMGTAPGVHLFGLKISDENGMSSESDVVAALQWVLENKDHEGYNIRVVNLSIQSSGMVSYHQSPLDAAVEILWFNGVVVVAASGNWDADHGQYNPIYAAPANDPFIITVGASNEKGNSRVQDDAIATFSADGLTQDFFEKPEIYAPGKDIISVLSKDSSWGANYPERAILNGEYFRISGTSMAAPQVTGAVALLLQAEPNLTPDQVKYRLINASNNVSNNPYLDVYAIITTPTTESANTNIVASQLLWSGNEPITWTSVAWNSVAWNSVAWNSVAWNSVAWNSVAWNSVAWNE